MDVRSNGHDQGVFLKDVLESSAERLPAGPSDLGPGFVKKDLDSLR